MYGKQCAVFRVGWRDEKSIWVRLDLFDHSNPISFNFFFLPSCFISCLAVKVYIGVVDALSTGLVDRFRCLSLRGHGNDHAPSLSRWRDGTTQNQSHSTFGLSLSLLCNMRLLALLAAWVYNIVAVDAKPTESDDNYHSLRSLLLKGLERFQILDCNRLHVPSDRRVNEVKSVLRVRSE